MGFNILYSHLRRLPYRYPMVMNYAQAGDFKIIHIHRRNALKTILTRTRAIRSRTFHSRSTVSGDKTTLPTAGLISQLAAWMPSIVSGATGHDRSIPAILLTKAFPGMRSLSALMSLHFWVPPVTIHSRPNWAR